MNDLSLNARPAFDQGPLTMSSREIAELTGKEHKNVLVDVRKMLETLNLSWADFSAEWKDSTGRTLPCFNLPKRECIILVSGYDVNMRARIIDRWMELEEAARKPALPDLNDPVVLTSYLLENAAKRIEAEAKLKELRPKADAHDRLAEAYGTLCRSTAAKNLGIPPHTLCRWLRTNGWTFRRPTDRDDLAYQSKIAAGLLDHKVAVGTRPDGTEWTSTQVRVTAKGMLALAKAFPPVVVETKPPRLGVVAGIGALAIAALAMPTVESAPVVFDAHAYLRDLDGAGIQVTRQDGRMCFTPKDGCRFGGFGAVNMKWQHAMRHCPDYNERISAALA